MVGFAPFGFGGDAGYAVDTTGSIGCFADEFALYGGSLGFKGHGFSLRRFPKRLRGFGGSAGLGPSGSLGNLPDPDPVTGLIYDDSPIVGGAGFFQEAGGAATRPARGGPWTGTYYGPPFPGGGYGTAVGDTAGRAQVRGVNLPIFSRYIQPAIEQWIKGLYPPNDGPVEGPPDPYSPQV